MTKATLLDSRAKRALKRAVDLLGATTGLVLTGWLIGLCWILARFDTGETGFFTQTRVGRHGRRFRVVKLRTMRSGVGSTTVVTTSNDPRITRLGRLFRRTKVDELPQLVNVLSGQMSFVGPRPDVPGYADLLRGRDRIILAVRPGITGPATVVFRDEEGLLASADDPESFNDRILWPAKVRLNRWYVENQNTLMDLGIVLHTLFPSVLPLRALGIPDELRDLPGPADAGESDGKDDSTRVDPLARS